jgi:sigma-E factor negative regulatory protein RseB
MTAGRLLLAATVVVITGLPIVVVATPPSSSASEWLEKMNLAVRTLNYQGRFVYQYGTHLEALYLSHIVTERGEHERLRMLNGFPREVVRDSDKVICSLPQRGNVNLDRRRTSTGFSPLLPIHADALTDHYEFELGALTRVAGRQAQEVKIRPRDSLRYGYRLALDLQHALPLRTILRDTDGRLISQIMFTELEVGIKADDAHAASGYASKTVPTDLQGVSPIEEHGQWMEPPQWRFDQTPDGFELNVHRRHRLEGAAATVEHFIFSDGLATVSVYVEPEQSDALEGLAKLGPVNAFGLRLNGHSVTAVGEVPAVTVQAFGRAITANSSDEH